MVQGVFTKLAAKSRPQKTLFCTFPSTRRRHTATNSAVSARLHKLIISSSGNSAATRASQDKSNLRSACRASGWLMSGLVRLGAYSGRSRRAQHADGMTHKSRNFGCAVIDRQPNVHVHVPCCPSTRVTADTPLHKKRRPVWPLELLAWNLICNQSRLIRNIPKVSLCSPPKNNHDTPASLTPESARISSSTKEAVYLPWRAQ
jgi:hypothetical protein